MGRELEIGQAAFAGVSSCIETSSVLQIIEREVASRNWILPVSTVIVDIFVSVAVYYMAS